MKAGVTCAVAGMLYMQPYRVMVVVGQSMEPTYSSHSLLLTEPVSPDELEHGMVVIANMDTGPIIKRIAYMPGDTILQAKLGKRWFDMIYMKPKGEKELKHMRWRRFVVPSGMVYVLGDNQRVSYDSKQFGCVAMARIHEKVVDQRPFDVLCSQGCTTDWTE